MTDNADQPAADQPGKLDSATEALADQGFAVLDDLPANHRLRAETLARNGATADPANHISPEAIQDAKDRLAAEAEDAAARAAALVPSMSWTKPALLAEAERRTVVIESDANKAAILAAIEAAPAPSNEG